MPYTLTVIPEHRAGIVHLTGRVTGAELISAAAELAAHPLWQSHFRAIGDVSEQASLAVVPAEFEQLLVDVRALRMAGEQGERVVVVRDEMWTSLVSLFNHRLADSSRPIRVVSTLDEAFDYLDITGT